MVPFGITVGEFKELIARVWEALLCVVTPSGYLDLGVQDTVVYVRTSRRGLSAGHKDGAMNDI